MDGQILRGSFLGEFLYSYCRDNPKIHSVVEIGTWRGMGSTKCIVEGLEDSYKENVSFVSLESNREMYETAVELWRDKSPSWLKLTHGRIVDVSDMVGTNLNQDEVVWFEEDKIALNSCSDVFDSFPEIIDLLFLDGGGFTTDAEFSKLKDRSKYILLDDTKSKKCINIRNHVLENPDKYEVLFDIPEERYGVMGFINLQKQESL